MIEGKRVKNYLIYALGEIILVVVGILIALGINDWQSEKSDKNELGRIIKVVQSDLEDDVNEAKLIIKTSEPIHELLTKYLYNPQFQDSIKDCVDCRYLMTQGQISKFNSKGHELLSNFTKDVKSKSRVADSLLAFYSEYDRDFFEFQNNIILQEVIDNMKYLRDNFDWYSEYYIGGNCNDDCITYFTSSDYRNRLTYFEALFFDNYLQLLETYKKDAEDMLQFLKS